MSIRNASFCHVRNIKITTVNFFARRVKGKFKLRLHPSIFPNLTFGLSKYSGSYKANRQFFEFNGLNDIAFRPSELYCSSVKVNQKLLRILIGMSKGNFKYHFINVPMSEHFDEEGWLCEQHKLSHNKNLNYWSGYRSVKFT